jgi:5-formyltetrahydrofolate cyclo-ligase
MGFFIWNLTMLEKQQLRQKIRTKRAQLTPEFRQQTANKIANIITKKYIYQKSKYIAAYIAVNGEVNPLPLMQHAWAENKTCYLPILTKEHKLLFAKYETNDPLINNRYNIPEPQPNNLIDPQDLDIVITPLVAFDKDNNRLGTGAGYYDRTFSFIKKSKNHKPYLIGIAYEFQKVTVLSPDPWDVPLDLIVTEQNNRD